MGNVGVADKMDFREICKADDAVLAGIGLAET